MAVTKPCHLGHLHCGSRSQGRIADQRLKTEFSPRGWAPMPAQGAADDLKYAAGREHRGDSRTLSSAVAITPVEQRELEHRGDSRTLSSAVAITPPQRELEHLRSDSRTLSSEGPLVRSRVRRRRALGRRRQPIPPRTYPPLPSLGTCEARPRRPITIPSRFRVSAPSDARKRPHAYLPCFAAPSFSYRDLASPPGKRRPN